MFANIYRVWIEPLWNWNPVATELKTCAAEFELNLYGIEICVLLLCIGLVFQQFELNLYGIEIC